MRSRKWLLSMPMCSVYIWTVCRHTSRNRRRDPLAECGLNGRRDPLAECGHNGRGVAECGHNGRKSPLAEWGHNLRLYTHWLSVGIRVMSRASRSSSVGGTSDKVFRAGFLFFANQRTGFGLKVSPQQHPRYPLWTTPTQPR